MKFAVSYFVCSASLISIAWSQSPQTPRMVSGRVRIPAMTRPLKLAEPNPISIYVAGERATSVRVEWAYYFGAPSPTPSFEDSTVTTVSYDSNGGAFVSATPLRLGKAQLTLFVSFADGGIERERADVQVIPSERQPEKLMITLGGDYRRDTPVVYMDLSEKDRTRHLDPVAIYKNVASPIPLSASNVTFRLIDGGAAEIDPSAGIVTALNIGQALVETSFRGVSTLTCIDVMENVGGGLRSRCEELLPPGRRLPPSGMELDPTPPPAIKVR